MDERDFDNIPDHCVVNLKGGGQLECRHCGASYVPALPCSIDMYLGMMITFGNDHRNCEEVPDGKAD